MRLKIKDDQKFKISAILDEPYLNTTKVNPKLENRKLCSSIIIFVVVGPSLEPKIIIATGKCYVSKIL